MKIYLHYANDAPRLVDCDIFQDELENDDEVLSRKGYIHYDSFFKSTGVYWIDTYYSTIQTAFKYFVLIEHDNDTEYVAFADFSSYLDFLGKYLPSMELMIRHSDAMKGLQIRKEEGLS